MRRALILVCVALGACDETVPPVSEPDPVAAHADPAMQSAAERECAEMTNYQPAKMAGMSSEMRALVQREYALCVARVGGGK